MCLPCMLEGTREKFCDWNFQVKKHAKKYNIAFTALKMQPIKN